MQLLYYHYFQIASVISGILFFRSLRENRLAMFLLLCTVGTTVDITSTWVRNAGYPSNHFILNYYPMLSMILAFPAFYPHLDLSARNKKYYSFTAVIVSAAFVVNYLFGEGMVKFNVFSQIFYYFFSILLSCGLLFKMAMREEYFHFTGEPVFWISAGILIFSMGALVIMGMSQFIRLNHLTIHNVALYNVIMPILNVILYSSFTLAFILCRLRKKSYLPSLS